MFQITLWCILYPDMLSTAFTKLPKGTISFIMSVRMKQLGSLWTDFCRIVYSECSTAQSGLLWLKHSCRTLYTRTWITLWQQSLDSSQNDKKNVSVKSCRENTYLISDTFFLPKLYPLLDNYEKLHSQTGLRYSNITWCKEDVICVPGNTFRIE